MISLSQLSREIGQYDPHSFLSFPGFKRKIIEASVNVLGRVPLSFDLANISCKSGISCSENFLKNYTGYPSGPGAFPFCIALMALICP